MVEIIKDSRTWVVCLEFEKDNCPHLFYPANYHGCRLLPEDDNECTLENCPKVSRAEYGGCDDRLRVAWSRAGGK